VIKFLRYAALLLTIVILPARADAEDQLTALLSQMHTLQAHFNQAVLDDEGRVLDRSSGEMALQRPGKFRWQTLKPNKQLLVADGQRVWFYDVDLEQVTVQTQNLQQNNSPAFLLSGSTDSLTKDFAISSEEKGDGIWFTLTPKKESNLFKTVQLYFVQNELRGMRLIDNLGQESTLKFTQIKNNAALSANLFQFKPPRGVDVINQAGGSRVD
jgi:outer membrane lipoprotein carrier protein